MRFHIMSDLHLEFADIDHAAIDVDEGSVVLLAGDIAPAGNGQVPRLLAHLAEKASQVIYVLGNHEYYGSSLGKARGEIEKGFARHAPSLKDRVHVTEQGVFPAGDGVTVLAAVLWTDFQRGHPLRMQGALQAMSDYAWIKDRAGGRLLPQAILDLHQEHLGFLQDGLARLAGEDGATVVMTHHAPSMQSVHPRYANDFNFNCLYCSALDELLLSHAPALWVHGHVHWTHDYRVGDTRVVCNPRGYRSSQVNEGDIPFDCNFKVDVPATGQG